MPFRIVRVSPRRLTASALVSILASVAGTACAAAADLSAHEAALAPAFVQADAGGWIVTLTGTLIAQPRYPGASEYAAYGYPSLDIRKVGEPAHFSTPDDGLSIALYESPALRIGPTARFVAGRYYGDDRSHLLGLRDKRFAVEPGLFVEYYPVPNIRTRVELRHGFYGHHGFVGSVGADYIVPVDRWEFSFGPRFNIGDEAFARKYFGVEVYEAVLNERVLPFSPNNYYAAGLLGAVTFRQDETWAYTLYSSYTRILGDSAESPLVGRPFGDPNQATLGLKVDYSFRTPGLF